MREYEIDHIVWNEKDLRIEVMYLKGKPELILATESVAAMLGEDAGLVLVDSSPGVVRWGRDREAESVG